jgi:hypothetical protein
MTGNFIRSEKQEIPAWSFAAVRNASKALWNNELR